METQIRVLQIINSMNNGGIESVVMNYYRHLDRTKIQFDFAVSNQSILSQKEEIEALGGRIYLTPPIKKLRKYKKALREIIETNHYRIVHCHMGVAAVLPLGVAKRCGVPYRICHAHSTASKNEIVRTLIKSILKPFSKKNANMFFSCGEVAGRWLYGNKFFEQGRVTIINNAIELDKFAFNQGIREQMRKELGVDDKFVIGHVGRFNQQKNHHYLIKIFSEIVKLKPNAVLVLIGQGPLEDEIRHQVQTLGLGDHVKFLGVRADVDKLYQAMDAFVLPSLYEGLPVVGVEAQANGLPCFVSDQVSKEVKILDNLVFLKLNDSAENWAKQIVTAGERQEVKEKFQDMHFDIKAECKKLEQIYVECAEAN